MEIWKVEDTSKVEDLFAGWQETMIWSCLGKVMGEIYTDYPAKARSAVAVLNDFAFFAGEPSKKLLLEHRFWKQQGNRTRDFMILVPQNEVWEKLIQREYGEKAEKAVRYAIKKEKDIFDVEKLLGVVGALPDAYSLKLIDRELYEYCRETKWCEDFVSAYEDYEAYQQIGLGVMILKEGVPVAGASSYTSYPGGIEIEIDTREDFRRRGLAYVSGAALILECLKRNLYPSWDAQNKASVALAEKLGYHYDHEYTVFECDF